MKRIIYLIVLISSLLILVGCVPQEVTKEIPEDASSSLDVEVADGLDDLDELDTLSNSLDEDIDFKELDGLDLE